MFIKFDEKRSQLLRNQTTPTPSTGGLNNELIGPQSIDLSGRKKKKKLITLTAMRCRSLDRTLR